MLDAKRLLDQFLGDPQGSQPGQPQGQSQFGDIRAMSEPRCRAISVVSAAVPSPGGLAGILLGTKQGRKIAGTAATVGGMALVGALAYGAYRNWQAGQAPAQDARTSVPLLPPPRDTPFNPASETEQQSLGLSLMRAMIAAAKSDGHVDAAEQANIFAQLGQARPRAPRKKLSCSTSCASRSTSMRSRAARARRRQAAEIYVASLLAIDIDNPAERGYLAMLAARLRLDEKLVAHLHATVEGAVQQAEPVRVAS